MTKAELIAELDRRMDIRKADERSHPLGTEERAHWNGVWWGLMEAYDITCRELDDEETIIRRYREQSKALDELARESREMGLYN